VDTRPPEMSQRSNRGVFVKLPPLVPISRKALRDQVFVAYRLPPTFNGIAFFVTQLLFLLFIVLTFFVLRTFDHERRLVISCECHPYLN
jgi:hypothetical protein